MPLESCMILLDNTEYMRNGDYIPTRIEAQQDAANLLVGAKTQSHPESTVGVSAGTELLVSPTDDVGKILGALHSMKKLKDNSMAVLDEEDGSPASNVPAAVQVASLALKHRRNKNGAQRIVLFVGSPLDKVETRALTKAGKQLKKNNIAIDVVAMGELEVNEPKLRELVEAANGRNEDDGQRTCHLVTIPAGVLPSDVLASSPIVHGAGGGGAVSAGGGFGAPAGAAAGGGGDDMNAFAEFGGVDPNMDPELAMALRVSMEEERARQERAAAAAASSSSAEESKEGGDQAASSAGGGGGGGSGDGDAEMQEESAPAPPSAADLGLSEEEALLQQALAMSLVPEEEEEEKVEESTAAPMDAEGDNGDEDAAMQMALRMSMMAEGEEEKSETSQQQQFQDPQFVNQLLGSLPGVDPNDPQIQEALRNAKKDDDKDKKDEDKKE